MKRIIVFCILFIFGFVTVCNAFTLTSEFGWREHPINGKKSFHSGIDLAADYGAPIPAMWSGQIVFYGEYGGYGNIVLIDHGNNRYTLYAHCSELYVSAGQYVEEGQVIAAVGSTGYSTGPHLHLELWENGQYVDPMIIFRGD
ncbi:M23 family metallopeptidase [Sporomusa sphaeroides]|uniref:Murein DD-endopeptidase MepM n=1 Tax=Sporomusa sphaeroides DSM 2875 TaxID=1337886 RepID=A0A1U7MA01_9FIRM|nr:M23 family metallopeptidase [Sporomusa sphaeroides]OLS54297.1 murein DD-endopeptidase MepM [Sporomusa sphaeroides DSM 2875]CVK21677.1 Murein DD-endopeptidase MepM [Sporomusa sphaeroides DSM 2875]